MTSPSSITPSQKERSQGLICPGCGGVVPVAEGLRIVECPYCHQHSLVQGDRGIRRWQVRRRIDRAQAIESVRNYFTGIRKARDLRQAAKIEELLLVYLPFWRVEATVAGWLFGRVKKGDDATKPDEHYVFQSMHWNDAAVDVSEFGVHQVVVAREDLEPFDSQGLHAEAMVFEPTESRTEAYQEAEKFFTYHSRTDANQVENYYENIQLLRPDFSLVYYPVWLGRYSYRKRVYHIILDGVNGDVMYGKAPGEILYRAAALIAGLAAGNLVLVNGTLLVPSLLSSDDNSSGLFFFPLAIGISLIWFGYRQFRYGEEVEDKPKKYQKAESSIPTIDLGELIPNKELKKLMGSSIKYLGDM